MASISRAIIVVVSFLCFVGYPATAQERQGEKTPDEQIGGQQDELERIKRKIEEHRQKSKELGQQEKATLKTLSNLDKEIDLSRQLLANLEQQEKLISERIGRLRAQIGAEDSALVARKAMLGKRLRQLYKRDPNYRLDILLGSKSLAEALQRYKYAQIIAEQDAALIADISDRKVVFEIESAELTESLADIIVVRNTRKDEAAKLERTKRQRERTLAQIRNEKDKHASTIEELEAAQKKIQDMIGELEKRRLETERDGLAVEGEFGKLQGKMIRPVQGKIVRGFGKIKHPTYGTVTFNNGVDIGGTPGAPIRAVASGVVEFVDWIEGYGKCIILNHGGSYYTLYAHVAATLVAQGQSVALGDVIAEVGDTGSLEGYVCHFEIRKSKQALDPTKWFAQ